MAGMTLEDAADALGVHYQTIYRWVRTGRLPAQKLAGRYVLDDEVVERERVQRTTPQASSSPPSLERLRRRQSSIHAALLDGDEKHVRQTVKALMDEGAQARTVMTELIAPALVQIGAAWHDGELDIWVEHRATAIVERTIAEMTPNPRGRRRGTAVVAAISGDRHTLPTAMATAALREDLWNVHHLGADMPAEEILAFVDNHDVDVVVMSASSPSSRNRAAVLSEPLDERGVGLLVGQAGETLFDLVRSARLAM